MPDASPTKWHLAHSTWFFETFILGAAPGYEVFDKAFSYLFNSYYETLGPRQARPQRGLLTRPSVEAVLAYRQHVDGAMTALLQGPQLPQYLEELVVLGLNHEQQHQELMLTDVLHLFAQNALQPAYDERLAGAIHPAAAPEPASFISFDGGLTLIGAAPSNSLETFAFDNEGPRHEVYLQPYLLCDRLVTNHEWLAFIEAGGYSSAEHWLAEGWARVQEEGWTSPLYWLKGPDDQWTTLSLAGRRPLQGNAPVTHVSFYEADAYARWRGLRLPTEAEWENAAARTPPDRKLCR